MKPTTASRLLALVSTLAVTACTSHDSSDAAVATGDAASAAAPWRTIHFASDTYDLAPGQERYLCYTMNLPTDAPSVVTAMAPRYGAGTHHIFFGYTLAPEPEGFHECPVLFRQTWLPLFLGGVASNELVMPAGVAVPLEPGQQLVLQLHLLGTSADPIHDHTDIDLKLQDPTRPFVKAGIFGFDDRDFSVAPHAVNQVTQLSCVPGHDMNVFGVLGHMHQYGTHIDLLRGGTDSTDLIYGHDWSFNDQPIAPVVTHVGRDERVTLRCKHSNATDQVVPYGESSTQEMCAAVFYYYPADPTDGCVIAPGEGDAGVRDGGVVSTNGNAGCATPRASGDPCVRTCNTGNEVGVGHACTAGGHECSMAHSAFVCTSDVGGGAAGYCTKPCTSDAACGSGATCVHYTQGSGCVPNECVSASSPGDAGAAGDASGG